MHAHLRKIRISSKKVNLVAGMVREKSVKEALTLLEFTPKKAAKVLYKVIQSAGANATNNFKQDLDTLVIKEIIVNQGPTYKRFQPVSKGRAHPILKRTSHVTVKVESDPELVAKFQKANAGKRKKAAPTETIAPETTPEEMTDAPEAPKKKTSKKS